MNIDQEECIHRIMSQTSYSKEEAYNKLNDKQGNYIEVIKDYFKSYKPLQPTFTKPIQLEKTINQNIYYSVRTFMNDVYKGYYERKEKKEQEKQNYNSNLDEKNFNTADAFPTDDGL